MKNKPNPAAILLTLTGFLFIAGIFFIGMQAYQQIQRTDQSLDTFISQVEEKQQELNDAQTAFADTIKEKKDLLNYQQKKASGKQTVVQEYRESSDTDAADTPVSVFSQDHD